MTKRANKYEEKIRNIVSYLNDYKEDPAKKEIYIEVYSDSITFEQLQKLSETFNTKNINLGSVEREEGYCDTCAYTAVYTTIRIGGIEF